MKALVTVLPSLRPEREAGSFLRSEPLAREAERLVPAAARVRRRRLLGLGPRGPALRLARQGALLLVPHIPSWYTAKDLAWLAELRAAGATLVLDVADRPLAQAAALRIPLAAERHRAVAAREEALFALADRVVANAPEWVEDRPGARVLRNAADLAKFPTPPPAPASRLVLYAGSLAPGRGVDRMAEAVALAAREVPAVRLRLLTAWPQPAWVDRVRSAAGPVPVELRGNVPNARLAAEHADAQVCLLPGEDDPYWHATDPLKLYDYMAAGRAIVATPCRAPAAVLRKEHAGLVASDFTPPAIARELVALLTDTAEARRRGQAGREAAQERHHWRLRARDLLAAWA